jgi:hypothetical protein
MYAAAPLVIYTSSLLRPDFSVVLSDLLEMRAADSRRTPAIHLLLRQQQHEREDKDDAFAAAAGAWLG